MRIKLGDYSFEQDQDQEREDAERKLTEQAHRARYVLERTDAALIACDVSWRVAAHSHAVHAARIFQANLPHLDAAREIASLTEFLAEIAEGMVTNAKGGGRRVH